MARYIDADKLKERLKIISVVADDWYGMGINRGLDRAETEIDMLPKADVVEVKHDTWEKRTFIVFDNEIKDGYHCSECNTTWDTATNYCPNCGANMRGDK